MGNRAERWEGTGKRLAEVPVSHAEPLPPTACPTLLDAWHAWTDHVRDDADDIGESGATSPCCTQLRRTDHDE